ncbi:MAG: DUF2029 domain-containing protein [Anaerolineales bacterium]|nr:DUF2029 domain-containing protein [Anaerolineales bacterium]
MRGSAQPRWLAPLLVLLVVGLVAGLTVVNYQFAQGSPGGNDFLARWNAANMWLREGYNPYDPQVSLRAQKYIYGREADLGAGEDLAHFVYPMPSMVFFAPFGLLPYAEARAVWMTILELGLALLGVLGIALAGWKTRMLVLIAIPVFSVLWYHGVRAVIVGQFSVIESLLLIGALAAIQRQRDLLAGVLLALSISKPQMSFLLIPFVLLWSVRARRWSLLAAFAAVFLGLLAGSFALVPSWLIDWLRQLVAYPSYTSLGSPVSILVEVLPGDPRWLTGLLSGALILGLLWEWRSSQGSADAVFQWTAALTLTITNLVAFRTATTHYVILLPALCLLFAEWSRRWGSQGVLAALGAMALLGVGLWVLFFATVEGNQESAWMYFPVPVVSLIGLWWIRWWVQRRARTAFT